jgi:hypothetical protein
MMNGSLTLTQESLSEVKITPGQPYVSPLQISTFTCLPSTGGDTPAYETCTEASTTPSSASKGSKNSTSSNIIEETVESLEHSAKKVSGMLATSHFAAAPQNTKNKYKIHLF